ncbi:MAG TPA: type I 3-dehydroquinate dehydratase [Terrimicrobiaceae bacterium]|nr:type I 3-dehydroquinate dehydratase [Terrimicrobiaceae bacterium]
MGTIHTQGGFAAARKLRADAVEIRVDALPRPPSSGEIARVALPAILTVRRFDEGGALALDDAVREALYLELLPAAAAVDLELRSLRSLKRVAEAARAQRRLVVVSHHDFQATPTLARLRAIAARARGGGADVVKIATRTESAGDVARLLALLDEADGPLAVMGMGPLGRASRLVFAKAGSALNYGWLDRPQVPGQWGAVEFGELLARA